MTSPVSYTETPPPSFLFDLDGTLIDSVYQHVIAWRAALADLGIDLSVWRIHRRIGMSGGLFVSALLRETGLSMGREEIEPEVTGNYRVGDIRHCFADITLARRVLGYEPAMPFEQGLIELASWLEGQVACDRVAEAREELAARGLTV